MGTTSEFNIDGRSPVDSATPETAAELASVLGEAAFEGATVVPFGGATALGLGNLPDQVNLAIATRGLARVLAYEPMDLTLSVEAGATVGAIQSVLREHGQELPIDVSFPDRATIGGVVATGYAGPRRLGDGTLRDLLIGASFARADGTIAKAGGMVVKNVSGFDLSRLMHGALGTLGVLTSLNLKVLPAAKADRTLLVEGDVHALTEAGLVACRLPLRPAAVELVLEGHHHMLAFRLRGRAQGIEEQARELEALLALEGLSTSRQLEGVDSVEWWQGVLDWWGVERSNTAQLLLRVRPRHLPQLVEGLHQTVASVDGAKAICSAGLGAARLNIPEPMADRASWLRACQEQWLGAVEDVVVQFCSPDAKVGLDVWGREPSGLPVMQALKRELDPAGALNRGRFVAFI